MTTFEEILARDGKLIYTTRGSSMQPMLRQNRDLVVIENTKSRLKRLDVALFKHDGKYILHRVVKVNSAGYTFRGDNNLFTENDIGDENVLGVLTGFVHNGKQHKTSETGYRLYSALWYAIYPLRYIYRHLRRFAGRLIRRIIKI